jgi:phage virion morphogenesis protein
MVDAVDLEQLHQWIGDLLARLDPGPRRRMALRIAKEIRRANAERIGAQVQPDGTPFAPRKPQKGSRGRVGTIKQRRQSRKMFAQLRQFRLLSAEASPDEAVVGFRSPAVARVARVHQLGLRDRVSRGGSAPEYDYPERVLLGLSTADQGRIMDLLVGALQS